VKGERDREKEEEMRDREELTEQENTPRENERWTGGELKKNV